VIHVPFEPDKLDTTLRAEFEQWLEKAERATRKVLDDHANEREITLNKAIWAGLKEWMFRNVFDGFCAYCEGDARSVSYGDAEHWRPKSAVSERNADGVDEEVRDAAGRPHPGYFWAAYDWRNLLPACQECNVGTKESAGKRTVFPIRGERVFSPGEAADFDDLNRIEQPLLLHPFDAERDPEKHIVYNEYGQPEPAPESEYGGPSIEVYNLDRDWQNRRRSKLREETLHAVRNAVAAQMNGGPKAVDTLRRRMRSGDAFTGATRFYIRQWYPVVMEELKEAP
jgi:hypothetical protein